MTYLDVYGRALLQPLSKGGAILHLLQAQPLLVQEVKGGKTFLIYSRKSEGF